MKLLLGGAALLALGAAATPAPSVRTDEGERLLRQCVSCHAVTPDADTPAGPTLHRIVGRRIAARSSFNYSPALRRFGAQHGRWSPELLDRFLADPEGVVPGTEMSFEGIEDRHERRALIAHLREGR